MDMTCEGCGQKRCYSLRQTDMGWLCKHCLSRPLAVPAGLQVNVNLRGYGNVSQARINELKRRVILPHVESEDGSYVVGRRGENGKVQDKAPSY